MSVLALDLGSYHMGCAVYRGQEPVAAWTHSLERNVRDPRARLNAMCQAVKEAALRYGVSAVVMERPWASYRSMAVLPVLEDAIRSMCRAEGWACAVYTAQTVRRDVCRDGRVGKKVLALAMRSLLPAVNWKSLDDHAVDAMALGWHHTQLTG